MGRMPQLAGAAAHDDIGSRLHGSFIWFAGSNPDANEHAVFRRSFELPGAPSQAEFHVFAYTRYLLFINGRYAGRGAARFELKRTEYDTWAIAPRLRPGRNVVTVLVAHDWPVNIHWYKDSLSRFRRHAPGFTALLEARGANAGQDWNQSLATDNSWIGMTHACRDIPVRHSYSSIPDNVNLQNGPDLILIDAEESGLPRATSIASLVSVTCCDHFFVVSMRTTYPHCGTSSVYDER